MSEWPEGWFRGDKQAGGSEAGDPTVGIPVGQADVTNPAGQYRVRQYADSPSGRSAPPGAWPEQPPSTSPPGGPGWGRGSDYGGGRGWRRWTRPRRIFAVLATLVVVVLVALVASYFYVNSKLTRQNILVAYTGRPAPASGTNWLITGSDSRQGLNRREDRRLSLGQDIGGQRSDTIMILHIPASGRPLLISLPRDSYVNIPGHGYNKINAAFAFGGPQLLAETVQNATGLYISHYMGIGFGGFVNVVNAVGGVRMCLSAPLHDVASGVSLRRGCQILNGGQALAYVRDRHNFVTQDLQREQDQRIFLKALLSKMTSAGVMFNPFVAFPAASGAASTLTVDNGTSLYSLYQAAESLRDPQTTTVPIANANYFTPAAGDAVLWDSQQAKQLFNDLNSGQSVPRSLLTGSSQAS